MLAPPHRWRARANWKIGSLNFIGDSQHVRTTHAGPIALDRVRSEKEGFYVRGGESFQVVTDEGHGCTLTYLAPGMPEENYLTHPPGLRTAYADMLSAEQLAMLHHLRVVVGNVFPNFSFIESQVALGEKAVIVRQWQPISGTEMEVLSWVLAEREASAEYKERALKHGFHNFGAAGVFEQDDLELWASATQASDKSDRATLPLQLPFESSFRRRAARRRKMARPRLSAVEHRGCPVRVHAPLGRRDAAAGLSMDDERGPTPASDTAFLEVQRFLNREAALLDRRDYTAWFDLLADDVNYAVTARVSRPGESGPLDYAIIDEDADALRLRVLQIGDPRLTRAENPPTLTRRFVSNLEVEAADPPNDYVAHSNLLVYRQRGTAPDGDFYAGRRRDLLRRDGRSLRLADRLVRLDHNVLFDGSLSIIL